MVESAVPILPSRNLDETLEFYSRLGFQLQGAPIEKYRYLIVGRGSIELHFWDAPNVDPITTRTGVPCRFILRFTASATR